MGDVSGGRVELDLGDAILTLDGPVVEVFLGELGTSRRWHVRHLRVEARPSRRGDHLELTLGTHTAPTRQHDYSFKVPSSAEPEVTALFEEAARRRDLLAAGPEPDR